MQEHLAQCLIQKLVKLSGRKEGRELKAGVPDIFSLPLQSHFSPFSTLPSFRRQIWIHHRSSVAWASGRKAVGRGPGRWSEGRMSGHLSPGPPLCSFPKAHCSSQGSFLHTRSPPGCWCQQSPRIFLGLGGGVQ